MLVSVIIPIIRPESAAETIRLIQDDKSFTDYEIITEEDTERIGCPKMVKGLVSRSRGDIICFLGDDTRPQPKMLYYATEAMKVLPDGWGMVGLNDGYWDGREYCTHWLCHKKLLPILDGEFFHTGYLHTKCDRELIARVKAINRYTWAELAELKHLHPRLNNSQWEGEYADRVDADYRKAYCAEWRIWDQCLFLARRQNGWKTPEWMLRRKRPIRRSNKRSKTPKTVVYTAITSRKDKINVHQVYDGADFVIFLDEDMRRSFLGKHTNIPMDIPLEKMKLKNSKWLPKTAFNLYEDPIRNAKIHKVLAHRYFPGHDYSLWMDGNVALNIPVKFIIDKYLKDADIAFFRHPEGTCLYQEAKTCIRADFDNPELIQAQVDKYKGEGYPEHHGLTAGTIILRKHNEHTERFNEIWWSEISQFSRRDQISLDYALWKSKVIYNYFEEPWLWYDDSLFIYNRHLREVYNQ